MATKGRLAVSFLTAALASGALLAAVPQTVAAQRATNHLMAQRVQMGLDADHSFAMRISQKDDALQQTHTRFDKLYNGIKVWGGDLITHSGADGEILGITTNHKQKVRLNVNPTLGVTEALAVAHQNLNPMGPYVTEPTAELVIYPMTVEMRRPGKSRVADQELNAEDVVRTVVRNALAYHIHVALENGSTETIHRDYMIDAHSGRILKQWNDLHTTAAIGTGNSQYSGVVSLDTNNTGSGFELRDMLRGTGGTFGNNVVTDLAHSTTGNGTVYTNATNSWGDGANYNGGSTTSANGQTAAVDAAYGIKWTWDYYKSVFGRNGIDNAGKASYLRVHYSSAYDNAFWSDACFCMTFGDGSSFKSLEAIDVAGHEMSHGVMASSANLTYSGESGGLNEANSDIHGTMVEFYAHGGGTTTVPATGGNWTIGEQLAATPLRYMYKPSLDGTSPDAWSSTIGSLDVHYSSGPMNREFYFLSQGSSSTSSSNFYSSYLPGGMTGVGNDHAARIEYRALTTYWTSSTNYASARTGMISAAKDLYGAGSAEEQAVWNSFAGINVGSAWGGTPPPPPPPGSTFVEVEANNSIAAANTVARTYTAIQGNLSTTGDTDFFALTLNPGENIAVAMTGPTGPDWDLKLVNSAGTQLAISQGSTTTENVTYTNSGATAMTVYPNVYIYSGTSATPYNLALTYTGGTPPPSDTTPPTISVTETGTTGTVTFNASATDNVGVTKVEWYVDGSLKGSSTTSPYSMTYNSTLLTNGSHTLTGKAYDAAANVGTSASVSFSVSNTTPPPPPGNTEVEPNDTLATAQNVTVSGTVINATMGSTTDIDYFKCALGAGRTITATMTPNASSDYDLYVYNSNGTQIGSSLNGTGLVDSVSVTNTGTSTFTRYAKVIYYAGNTGSTGTYTMKLTF